jgi:preprotein translocase subunit SecA
MNKQRDVIYKRRKNALFGDHLKYDITNMIFDVANLLLTKKQIKFKEFEYEIIKTLQWNLRFLNPNSKICRFSTNDIFYSNSSGRLQDEVNLLKEKSFPIIENVYQNQGSMFKMIQVPFTDGHKTMTIVTDLKKLMTQCESLITDFEKNTLSIIDENWKLHLREMDDLKKIFSGSCLRTERSVSNLQAGIFPLIQ